MKIYVLVKLDPDNPDWQLGDELHITKEHKGYLLGISPKRGNGMIVLPQGLNFFKLKDEPPTTSSQL